MRIFGYAALLITCLANTVCAAAAPPVEFETQIRPLLLQRCGECHGPETQEADLRLDARHVALGSGVERGIIVPGNAEGSELLRRIRSTDPDEQMPPDGERLSEAETRLLARWIDEGAIWPESDYDRAAAIDRRREHWAFQPPTGFVAPAADAHGTAFPADLSDIDRFIRFQLSQHDLTASPSADRRTLIRRLWLTMLGLPPSPEDVDAFVDSDDPQAFEQLVDRVLASPHYGERWAQHWLDVVRYADTHGFEVNTPREHAWPYRDYVIQAWNEDRPFEQFIREQIAGDTLGADAATGFLVAAAVLLPGQIGQDDASKRQARQDALDEIIVGTSGTFLGLTLGCARCHDHKFDPITQADYYAMQAFFAGVEYGDRPIRDAAYQTRLTEADSLEPQIQAAEATLRRLQPIAFSGRTLVIDELDGRRTSVLVPPNGQGTNPAGTQRGYRDDPGDGERMPNISGGQYTWWPNVPGQDVMTWNPGTAGQFRLWLSWGVHGSGVHTRDAVYLLDEDGDLATAGDQRELARVDQYYPAGVTEGTTELTPQWSGLLDVGLIDLQECSRIVLRGGETGTGITADVIVLQESGHSSNHPLPQLRLPVSAAGNVEQFAPVTARFVRFTVSATIDDNRHEPCLDELEIYGQADAARNLALAASGAVATSSGNYPDSDRHKLSHINDGQYGNERSWISSEHGGGWVCIELPEAAEINRMEWARDRTQNFADRLPTDYRIDVSADGQSWQQVAGSSDRMPMGTPADEQSLLLRNLPPDAPADTPDLQKRVRELRARQQELRTPQQVYAGVFRLPDETFVLRRGDPEQKLREIEPQVPEILKDATVPETASDVERRRFLAEWIASPDNPLTARVLVNRLWMHHFGRGIVETTSDFGINGAQPSHPELLDWLAREFVHSGWSVKHIQRLILLSQTWQQDSRIRSELQAVDSDNRQLWRFRGRRLEAEAIRDSLLSVSGELNPASGGPGFDFFQTRGGLNGFPPVTEFYPAQFRRMIYAHRIRMEPVPVFGAFDCPDAGQPTSQRTRSTTAIQALNLFNSPFVMQRAEHFAARVVRDAGSDAGNQVRHAFRLALGRLPRPDEFDVCVRTAQDYGLAAVCRALFNCNEFLYVP